MRIITFMVALLSMLAGCTSTAMRYQNSIASDAACIKGNTANFFRFFLDGEAHVHILEIDGMPTGGKNQYCVLPGTHILEISATNNNLVAQDHIEIEFIAAHKYLLKANWEKISFVFQLMDITNPKKPLVTEFELGISSAIIPVFIP